MSDWRSPFSIGKRPQLWDWFYLFLVGAFSQLGQIFLTNALQKERAASVAIVNYTGLLYGLLIGWFVFGETQTAESLAGMILVVVGVVLSVIYSKRKKTSKNSKRRRDETVISYQLSGVCLLND
jgi:drug/metabolite transporter (DMT)-like permease